MDDGCFIMWVLAMILVLIVALKLPGGDEY